MEYQFIEFKKLDKGVGQILLNRPNKRNALCNPLRQELFNCLEECDKDEEVRAIIISGNGSYQQELNSDSNGVVTLGDTNIATITSPDGNVLSLSEDAIQQLGLFNSQVFNI